MEYPLLDGLGSVRQLTDASGNVILSRSYDAYGNVRLATGTGSSRLGYTGELQDSASGLVYLRARYYHPTIGRFLQRDSFGGFAQQPQSLNQYTYAASNPVRFSDPSGHCAVNSDGSRAAHDAECWRLADAIYAMWDDNSWFAERFRIGKENFMNQIAAAGPDIDADWMQLQLDLWYADFAFSHGLQNPYGPVVWHKPLPHQSICDTWDCVALFLDTGSLMLSVCGDLAGLACIAATEGACAIVVIVKVVDIGVSTTSLGYAAGQWASGDASDLDLAVNITGWLASVSPVGGEVTGWSVLAYDAADPFLPDETMWGAKAAK